MDRRKLYIWICYLLSFCSGLQMSGQQFVLLDMKTTFGISNATMAAITSVQLVTSILMTLALSVIVDKMDHRKLMIIGGSVSVVGLLLSGFSISPVMTIGAMFISGIGSSITMALPASIFTNLDETRITRHVNIQQGALSFGAFLAPLALSLLMNTFGMVWRWHYYISAILLGAIISIIVFIKPDQPLRAIAHMPEDSAEVVHKRQAKSSFILQPTFICISLALGLYMAMEAGLLNYVKQYFEIGVESVLGVTLCIPAIRLGMTITRLMGERLLKNRVYMGVGTFLLSGLCLLFMAIAPSATVGLVCCTLFGFVAGPCWPTIYSMGLEIDTGASGRLSNLMMLFNSAGMHLGNFFIGTMVDTVGVVNSYYTSATIAIPGVLVFLLAVRAFRKAGLNPEGINRNSPVEGV